MGVEVSSFFVLTTMVMFLRQVSDHVGFGHRYLFDLAQGKEYKQLAREASDRASYRIFDSKYVRSCFGCHCEVVVGAWLIIWVLLSLCGAFLNVLSSFAIWSDLPTEGSLLIN